MVERVRRHLRTRGEWYWAPLVYVAAVCVLYYPVLGGQVGFGWDAIETYWPDLVYFADQIRGGEFPLWNPYDRGGYPFYADPQAASMYPVQWLFAGFGALIGDAPWWLIQAKMLGHHVLAASLMHLFLRSRGLERSAAIIGALALIACTPWLIHKASNVIHPMAWTPLLWMAIDRFATHPNARRALILAVTVYVPGSAGSPPGFFYTLLLAGGYGAYRLVSAYLKQRSHPVMRGYGAKVLTRLVLAGLVTTFLLLIVVLPGLDLAELTARQSRGLAYSLSFPLPPKQTILGLWVPSAGKPDAYLGLLPLLLAVLALGVRPTRDRGITIAVWVLAAFFLVLSFGSATPILGWLVENIPGFGLFRAANRYKLLSAVLLSVAAGYGTSTIIRAGPKITKETIRVAGAVLFMLAITAVLALKLSPAYADAPPPIHSLRFAVVAVVIVLATAWLRAPRAQWVVLLGAVLMLFDASHFWHTRGKILETRPNHLADRDALRDLPRAGKGLRIYDEYQLEQRAGSRLGIRDFRGYPSGDPLDFSRYKTVLSRANAQPELLAAFNVGYVLNGSHHRNRTSKNHLKSRPSRIRPKLFAAAGRVDITRDPAPWVSWHNTILTVDEPAVLDAVALQARRSPNERIAIIEPDGLARLGEHRADLQSTKTLLSGSGDVVEFESDRVLLSVRLPSPSLVILNEVSYPGWRVYVDGEEAPALRSNFMLRAVAVDAGPHLIEWRFEPARYPWLFVSWLLAMLAVLLAVTGPRARVILAKRRGE